MKKQFAFLQDPEVQNIMISLEEAGYEALIVGGAARDALLGQEPKDIDMATNATPDQVNAVLAAKGAKIVPTGIEHGTITAVLNDKDFEITTYRKDVDTDGRHATIAFASSFDEDAKRRDLTMNAIGIDRHGNIKDPTGQGISDLESRTLRFVGDGNERCKEDSLRALRLFRFQGRLGTWPMDEEALGAARNADLSNLSGERIWSEMKGILSSKNGHLSAKTMVEEGVMGKLLPDTKFDIDAMMKVKSREDEAGLAPSHEARLHALTNGRARFPWPMSGKEARHLDTLAKSPEYKGRTASAGSGTKSEEIAKSFWLLGDTPVPQNGVMSEAIRGRDAVMPVNSSHFMSLGKKGPEIGMGMKAATQEWLDSNLERTSEQLMQSYHQKNLSKSKDNQR